MLQLIKGKDKKQYDMKWIRTPKEIWEPLSKEFNFTVDACASQGIPCIGIKGIWSWRGRNDYDATTALGDWHDIAIKNNYFFIAFDSDIRTNSKIAAAAKELKSFLDYKQAKSVKIIYLPYEGIEKKGIDDWIADKKKGLI